VFRAQIVSSGQFSDAVCWSLPNGTAFTVLDVPAFSDRVLPRYFKHNNFQSFVRYGLWTLFVPGLRVVVD
jgi:hypothetical protein